VVYAQKEVKFLYGFDADPSGRETRNVIGFDQIILCNCIRLLNEEKASLHLKLYLRLRNSRDQTMVTLLSTIAVSTPCRNKQIDVKAIAVSNGNIEYPVANVVRPDQTDDSNCG
jgi:hypothetical protein